MERVLICLPCKFGEYMCYNFRDIEFFLGVTFWRVQSCTYCSFKKVVIGSK